MSKLVSFTIGDLDYEVVADGDRDEVRLEPRAWVHISPEVSDVCTLETLVREYAAHRGISEERALSRIEAAAHEDLLRQLADDWQDSREYLGAP